MRADDRRARDVTAGRLLRGDLLANRGRAHGRRAILAQERHLVRKRAIEGAVAIDGERVWYFAYGSNMQRATFAGRRGIAPTAAHAARVAGWRLVVDKPPLIPVGHAFANLVPDPDAEVFGVLYQIRAGELAHVELTEGVTLANYRRIEIDAVPLVGAAVPSRALMLVSDKRDPELRPSAHYMALLVEGAVEHDLPAAWIDALRAVPTASDTAESAVGRALIDDVLGWLRR